MTTSLVSFVRSHRRLVAFSIGVGTLSFAAIAIASIISDASTTGGSNHVTYTQLTLNVPSTVTAGDVMVAGVAIKGGTADVVTAPTGWTQITRTDNDVNSTLISYWKVAGASEASSYTWTIQDQTRAEGGITDYHGVSTTSPIDAFSGNVGRGKVATTTAITTSATNEEVVALFATDIGTTSSGGYFNAPTTTSMTTKYDAANGALGPSVAAFDASQASAGSTGSISSATGDNKVRDWSSQEIALRPAPTIMFDNADNATFGPDVTGTLNFTTSGTNRILVVSIANTTAHLPTSVTYDGVPMTLAESDVGQSIWYLINPDAGNHAISVQFANTDWFSIMATSLDGVDQTTGIGAVATSSSPNNDPGGSLNITTTRAGSWIVDGLGLDNHGSDNDPVPTGTDAVRRNKTFINVFDEYFNGAQSTEPTIAAGVYSDGYTWTGTYDWHLGAVEILSAN